MLQVVVAISLWANRLIVVLIMGSFIIGPEINLCVGGLLALHRQSHKLYQLH